MNENPSKGKAIASMVCGIVALVVVWFGYGAFLSLALAIVGLILGIKARNELSPTEGRGMATAGMICSIVALAISAVFLVSCILCAGTLFSIANMAM